MIAMSQPPHPSSVDALKAADDSLLQGLRSGLLDGRLRSVAIHAGSGVIELDAWSRWRFWRRESKPTVVAA